MDFAPEQGLDVAIVAPEQLGTLHEVPDAGEALEVLVDEVLGLSVGNPEVVGQPEGGNTVDDAEVDRLGVAPDHGVHAFDRHPEDLAGRHGMNVEAIAEGLPQGFFLSHVRGQPQLDLRVVDRDQLAARLGDEGGADLAPCLGPHRDVLQVRVGR